MDWFSIFSFVTLLSIAWSYCLERIPNDYEHACQQNMELKLANSCREEQRSNIRPYFGHTVWKLNDCARTHLTMTRILILVEKKRARRKGNPTIVFLAVLEIELDFWAEY